MNPRKSHHELGETKRLQFVLQRRDRLHFAGLAAGYFAGALIYLPVLLPESLQALTQLWERWPNVNGQDLHLSALSVMALIHAVLWVAVASVFSDYQLSHGRTTLWAFIRPSLVAAGILTLLGPVVFMVGDGWFESGVVSILGLALGLVLWLSLHAYWWVAIRVPPELALQLQEEDRGKNPARPPASPG